MKKGSLISEEDRAKFNVPARLIAKKEIANRLGVFVEISALEASEEKGLGARPKGMKTLPA
jgi:hypothetical protein